MIDNSTILAGVGVAGVAAAWQQVKQFFSYASSFIIVRAKVSSSIGRPVERHLKRHWKVLPSGIFTFISQYMPFKKEGLRKTVPFRVWNDTTVLYRNGLIVILSADSMGIKLTSLRGMIDFQDLISEALDEEVADDSNLNINKLGWNVRRRGHYVKHVIGYDKSMPVRKPSNRGGSTRSLQDADAPAVGESPNSTAYDRFFHQDLDDSFKYPRVDWEEEKEEYDPFSRLFYSDEIMRHAHEAIQWLDMRQWYYDRMIPWRRGWLLYGVGGTGKSSMAKAIADKMGVALYWYHLATLSDQEFIERWNDMETPCVVLFEDFDTVFDGRVNVSEHKSLSFDAVLNCLSGVMSNHGVFTIITTNHIEKIDPAMGVMTDTGRISSRPGRIDTVIEFGVAEEESRRRLASVILRDWPEQIEKAVNESENYTIAQVEELCVQKAFQLLAERT